MNKEKHKITKGYAFLFNDIFLFTKDKKSTSKLKKIRHLELTIPLRTTSLQQNVQIHESQNKEFFSFELSNIVDKKKFIFW